MVIRRNDWTKWLMDQVVVRRIVDGWNSTCLNESRPCDFLYLLYRQDIYLMCRELNMEDSVHDLMVQLGADRHGRISFEEFLRCQRKLRGEIRSVTEGSRQPDLRRGSADGVYQDRLQRAGSPKMGSNSSLPRSGHLGSWPASSDNSLGASSTARDSWERDSGARDLSPEPGTFLQKLMDSATAAGGGANFLELANTVSTCLCLQKKK
ncbi:uncharacterized protein LOC129255757 [Lytechinus pictus]|uniref:uncharacterized protein LOC129255757 n=1 Tax=Lytechinus pictus TaxID=7653 RepID=UPI0030BA029D